MGHRARTILLGLLTIWPPIYMVVFVGFILAMVTDLASRPAPAASAAPISFAAIFVLHVATMLICIALCVVYVVDVYRSPRIPADKRVLWVILILMGGMIAMPVYWYLYMWRDDGT